MFLRSQGSAFLSRRILSRKISRKVIVHPYSKLLCTTMSEPARKRRKSQHVTDEIVMQKHENYNKDLTDILGEVGIYEKVQGHQAKFKAYSKAVKALTAYPHKVKSGDEARKIDGIGAKISKKIDEILSTGQLCKLEGYRSSEELNAIRLFQRISGVGPSAAIKWVKEKNYRTLEDLKKEKLNAHQAIGYKYFDEFEQRIPRDEVQKLERVVMKTIQSIDSSYTARTCGSYRRGKPNSGDIDVLITHPSFTEATKNRSNTLLEDIVSKLTKSHFLTDHISKGALKYMGVCQLASSSDVEEPRLHRRIDLRLVPKENFWCGLLYFTGSDYFNTQMRTIALERGFTLNEYSLVPIGETGVTGQPLEVTCEEDIFDMLCLKYRSPEDRDL